MTDTDAPEWPDPADKAYAVEQAKRLRNQVAEGGLRFEAYLPPSLALWLLDLIEQGKFLDPSEAVFVILGEHKGVTTRKWRICPTFKNVSGTQVGLTVDVVAFSALRAS